MMNCLFKNKCSKFNTERCNELCYAYTFMQGDNGQGGMWATTNVPAKYRDVFKSNLPNHANFERIKKYIDKLPKTVEEGIGLFLFSVPTPENKFGTGNGKTTSACAIMNEFVILQAMRHIKGEIKLEENPALFMKLSDFQNLYNSQFRGSAEIQQQNADKYYRYKDLMKNVSLLVFDDIAIRTGTEAFLNELYEIIDHRVVENLATIYTTNIPPDELTEYFGERIVSRIEGSTVQIPFTGKDHRKKDF